MNGLGLPAQCCFCLYRFLVEHLSRRLVTFRLRRLAAAAAR